MRLTLRTLLAYLDDRLTPANTKELGQKIAKSPFATELVERIREVKRRRRLAMPDKPVTMIDPNLVAEYLDDQLTPELVARVEKQILSSDTMLAEVASAHEILGQLRDPVTVEPGLRDRLYSLDPTGTTDVVRALAGSGGSTRPAETSPNEWKPLVVPGKSSRRLPMVIVAGLAMLWLAIVVSDSVLFGPRDSSKNAVDAENNGNSPDADLNNQIARVDPPAADDQTQVASTEVSTTPAAPTELTAVAVPGPTATPDSNAVVNSVEPKPTESVPPSQTSTSADPSAPLVAAAVPDAAEVPAAEPVAGDMKPTPSDIAPEPATSPTINLIADNRTVFVFDESLDRWSRLGKIPGGEGVIRIRNLVNCMPMINKRWIGVAYPFQATVFAGDRGWSATVFGNTLARIVTSPAPGLNIWSGRMKLAVDAAQPWQDDAPPSLVLKNAGVDSILTLRSKDAVIGVEVIPVAFNPQEIVSLNTDSKSAGGLLHLDGADFQVTVIVTSGQITIQMPESEQPIELMAGSALSWLAPGSADDTPPSGTPENIVINDGNQIASAPEWLRGDIQPLPEAEALNAIVAEALANGEDPALSVTHLLTDRNPQVGVRAVQILAVSRDVDRLLSAMFETLDESVHRAAIDGLSQIANGSLSGRYAIRSALETRMSMSEVEMTVLLIAGVGDAEARDPAFCQSLLDLLNSERLATRTLAFYRIQKYSNDRLGYQPEAESSRRRDAVRRWQKFLDRNGGKLLP